MKTDEGRINVIKPFINLNAMMQSTKFGWKMKNDVVKSSRTSYGCISGQYERRWRYVEEQQTEETHNNNPQSYKKSNVEEEVAMFA